MSKTNLIAAAIIVVMVVVLPSFASPWTEYRITTSPANQRAPDIEGNIVAWNDYRSGDSGIYGATISDINHPMEFVVATSVFVSSGDNRCAFVGGNSIFYAKNKSCYCSKQTTENAIYKYDVSTRSTYEITPPCCGAGGGGVVSGADENMVVWNLGGVYIKGYDVSTQSIFQLPFPAYGTCSSLGNQFSPDVSGNLVVWNDSCKIYGFDLLKWQRFQISSPSAKPPYVGKAKVSGKIAVWQDCRNNYPSQIFDIYAADMSDPCNPVEFPVSINQFNKINLAIGGNIIVWQDNRNGNWDIYGYDLSTQTEFQITDNPADQINPSISGHTVVWEDYRNGQSDIYATILYGPQVPQCTAPLVGDLNNDCKVDFEDFAIMTSHWLDCNLDPPSACWK